MTAQTYGHLIDHLPSALLALSAVIATLAVALRGDRKGGTK